MSVSQDLEDISRLRISHKLETTERSVAPPSISMADIIRGIVPFLLLMVGVALLCLSPQIALWLPSMMK